MARPLSFPGNYPGTHLVGGVSTCIVVFCLPISGRQPAPRVYIKSTSKLSVFDIGGCGPPQPNQRLKERTRRPGNERAAALMAAATPVIWSSLFAGR